MPLGIRPYGQPEPSPHLRELKASVRVLPMDGAPRRWTLHRPAGQITEDDLRAVLLAPGQHRY